MIAYYLTHTQVDMERERPVPLWRLSARGRARLEAIRDRAWLQPVRRILSSAETKAIETASILAANKHSTIEIRNEMGENDRSSTGFLEQPAFENAADRFFAEPDTSWNGWERAADAADRIERAVRGALGEQKGAGPVLFVGHGGVGTLLKCRISKKAITRDADQPAGGGNIFSFDIEAETVLCDWTAMEEFDEPAAHV